jgi:hypothetical protein
VEGKKEKELLKEMGPPVKGLGLDKLKSLSEGRVSTLKKLKSRWDIDGIHSQFVVVDGAKHEVDKIFPAVIEFLCPLVKDQHGGYLK